MVYKVILLLILTMYKVGSMIVPIFLMKIPTLREYSQIYFFCRKKYFIQFFLQKKKKENSDAVLTLNPIPCLNIKIHQHGVIFNMVSPCISAESFKTHTNTYVYIHSSTHTDQSQTWVQINSPTSFLHLNSEQMHFPGFYFSQIVTLKNKVLRNKTE